MPPNDLIAQAIQRVRSRKGLSLSALAAKAGLAKPTLSQLESGKGNPSIEPLWTIAGALEVTFSTLFETSRPELALVRASDGAQLGSDQALYPNGAKRFMRRGGPGLRLVACSLGTFAANWGIDRVAGCVA